MTAIADLPLLRFSAARAQAYPDNLFVLSIMTHLDGTPAHRVVPRGADARELAQAWANEADLPVSVNLAFEDSLWPDIRFGDAGFIDPE